MNNKHLVSNSKSKLLVELRNYLIGVTKYECTLLKCSVIIRIG